MLSTLMPYQWNEKDLHLLLFDLTAVSAVHALHDHPARAIGSPLLRFGAAMVGALVGMAVTPDEHTSDPDPFAGAGTGFLVGSALGAMADYGLLAKD